MITRQYAMWSLMLALLIIGAMGLASSILLLLLYAIGVKIVGIFILLAFFVFWLLLIQPPYWWFIGGA